MNTFKQIIFLLFFLSFMPLYAQKAKHGNKTINTSNTIINEYTVLTQDASVGDITINVQNSGLNANNRFPNTLQIGDLLMIIQMQGASSASYEQGGFGFPLDNTWGAVSNYNNCGLHEFVQVKSIPNATSITIDCGLKNAYTADGRTQVIRVPRYQTLSINAGGVLTCENWDGSKGGVVAVEVNGNSIIHSGGSIYTTGKGFRGGQLDNDFFWGGGQWASTNSTEGAEKGESILGFQNDYSIYGGRYCRGAPANGGGGGNTHNAGGGGGANGGIPSQWNGYGNPDLSTAGWATAWNLEGANFANNTSSGGGRGGYSFSNSNQNAMSLAPASSAWGGDYRRNNGGLGGRPLDYSTGRIFLGGGGGAGEQNDNYGGAGGAGGGLVYFLSYGSVSGDGLIVADGAPGQNSSSPWGILGYDSDGAGGGGGGGAVIFNTFGSVDGISIQANGGVGGTQNIISSNKVQAQGPGGGGGGGYIAISNGNPPRQALGGNNGTTNSSSLTEFIPNGATRGGVGTNNAGITNFQIIAPNDTICGSNTATLQATLIGTVPPNTVITWYDSIVGGNVLGTGNTFTTPTLTTTTTFYVGTCPGHYRNPVTVVVVTTNYSAGNNVSICHGGSVALNASGGTNYQWSPSTGLNNPAIHNPVASPVATTTYTVSISDNIGCSGTASVIVTVDNLVAFAGNDTTICPGGQAQLIASGGLNYQWAAHSSLSQTNIYNPVATPTTTTTYTVTVSDNTGCEDTDEVVVFLHPAPQADAGQDSYICQGNSVSLSAGGGVDYQWQHHAALDNPNIPNPTATPNQTTTFTVTVTDNNGCTDTDSVTVFIQTATAQVSNDTTICQGGSVQLIAGGGNAYLWLPAYSLDDSLSSQPIAQPDSTTTYTVEVTDTVGCVATASVTVTVVQAITAGFSVSGLCEGDSTYFTDNSTDVLGNISTWDWNFGNGNSASGSPVPSHMYNQTGSYNVSLYVENNFGCSDTISKTIVINEKPHIAFTAHPSNGCVPMVVSFDNQSTNSVSYQWLFGTGTTSNMENPQHTYFTAGTYNVVLTGTSADNCSGFATQTISLYNSPQASFNATPAIGNTATPVSFNNTSNGGNSWLWNFGDGGSSTEQNPTHSYSSPGTYQVELYVQNIYNCTDTAIREVVIEDNMTFFMPNAFKPNGNGLNDTFGPKGIGLNNEYFEMYIYDRWGKQQFYTNDFNKHWDGRSARGNLCPPGVYTWVVYFKTHSGVEHKYRFTGTVTLL